MILKSVLSFTLWTERSYFRLKRDLSMKSTDLYILRRNATDLSPALFTANDCGSPDGAVVVMSSPRGLTQSDSAECHDALSYSKLLELVLTARHIIVL